LEKKIIIGNLLMKRDSNTKGPSSSPPLDGGFFEHSIEKQRWYYRETTTTTTTARRVVFAPRRGVQKRTHFLSVVWVSFFTQLNKPLKETIETIEFGTLFATSAQKQRSPPSPHQPRRRPKGGRKR